MRQRKMRIRLVDKIPTKTKIFPSGKKVRQRITKEEARFIRDVGKEPTNSVLDAKASRMYVRQEGGGIKVIKLNEKELEEYLVDFEKLKARFMREGRL